MSKKKKHGCQSAKKNTQQTKKKIDKDLKKDLTILGVSALVLIILIVVGVIFSNRSTSDPTTPTELPRVQYYATVYSVANWNEKDEEGNDEYYLTLLVSSDNLYSTIDPEEVLYSTDAGYEELTKTIENTKVETFNVNEGNREGTLSYIKITSDHMLDSKKIYIYVDGVAEYQEGVTNKEEYIEKNGSADGWYAMYSRISSRTPSWSDLIVKQTETDRGVIRMYDDCFSQYYYSMQGYAPIVDGDTIKMKIDMIPLKVDPEVGVDVEAVLKYLSESCVPSIYVDEDEEWEVVETLDENLEQFFEIVDDEIWFGFRTVDGTNIADFEGDVPDALVYEYHKAYYFTLNK